MDDARLLETVCWALSTRSLTPGAKFGSGTITRQDVWAALGGCRSGWEDAGPDLLYIEADRMAQSGRAIRGDGVTVWPIDLKRIRDQIAVAAHRAMQTARNDSKDREAPALGLAQGGAEYALAHWQFGRYAGPRWTLEACAKRVRWATTGGEPATGVRLDRFCEHVDACESVLHSMRDEAMSRFRRQLLAAREAA